MSIEKSFSVTLKLTIAESGSFDSIRLLKGRSNLPEDILEKVNKVLKESLIPTQLIKTVVAIGDHAEQTPIKTVVARYNDEQTPITIVAIGDHAEQKIMNHLLSISRVNMDFNVIDTSSQTGHGDMSVIHQGRRICIEVKSYSRPVPMKEIEKYHKSLKLSEYDAGIIIQLGPCGYCAEANIRTPIDIRIQDGKPSAYLTAIDLEMIYPIINMQIMNIDLECRLDQNELDGKRKALLAIHEKIVGLRTCIESQKKTICKMEELVESVSRLSLS